MIADKGHSVCLPFFLTDTRVDCNAGEVAFPEQFVEFGRTKSALYKDDDLVEFKAVEQFVEFTVLLRLIKLDAVLLETV